MNLFFQRLTGTLMSTNKMEQRMLEEAERIARYRQVEQSKEMEELLELKKIVTSKEFEQKKYNLTHTKYKTTQVYHTLATYKQMQKDKLLQMYLNVRDSDRLKAYLEFRQSEDYVKLQSKKEVKNSLELKHMAAFEKSKEYKAYLQYKDSKLPERYLALQQELSTPEWQKEHAFWTNPHRWLTTEEYQQEVRYKQLMASPDIVFYFKQNKQEIEKMENWECIFTDDFTWLRLSESKWKAGFVYKSNKLPAVHSFANEQQANTGGKNVGAVDGNMCIFTKNEKTIAPAWDQKLGFINKDFDYTSDIVQTADNFRTSEGLIMAKIRVSGNIHHAFWLGSENKLPVVSIFHFNGKKITLGNYTDKGIDGTTVSGINAKQDYIYSLRWTSNEMIWYVNNKEVHRTNRNIPKEKLYLAFSSFISENQKPAEGKLNVAWVKVFGCK